jgi:hypothetical protein
MQPLTFAIIGCIAFLGTVLYLNSDTFNLKCTIAHKDGKTYCVRDSDRVQESVELLAEATGKLKEMVDYLHQNYPQDERVKLLIKNFNPNRIVETLPTSEFTAYSEDKGSKLAFCLRKDKDSMQLIDLNTLTFVGLHELSHLLTTSIGHKQEFWTNFKFVLENAVEAGIYTPIDYSKKPKNYCGLMIDNNPLY